MRILIAPDSFKGTLSASAVAAAIAAGLADVLPQAELVCLPMADGGEGTLAALNSLPGVRWHTEVVRDLNNQPIGAAWLTLADGTAVLESAQVLGLGLAGQSKVQQRHSMGLGQLLRAALQAGAPQIMIGLGGTGTNDGGAGLLVALGARLLDAAGTILPPVPAAWTQLRRIDLDALDPRIAQTRLIALADVDNPLAGPGGATAVFGPQKGVRATEVAALDAAIARLGALGDAASVGAHSDLPGSGAAGGLGWALRLLGAEIRPGAEMLADMLDMTSQLAGADYLITGEGQSDRQTCRGKLPWRLAARATELDVPSVLISGHVDPSVRSELARQFTEVWALTDEHEVSVALRDGEVLLRAWARQWAERHLSPT